MTESKNWKIYEAPNHCKIITPENKTSILKKVEYTPGEGIIFFFKEIEKRHKIRDELLKLHGNYQADLISIKDSDKHDILETKGNESQIFFLTISAVAVDLIHDLENNNHLSRDESNELKNELGFSEYKNLSSDEIDKLDKEQKIALLQDNECPTKDNTLLKLSYRLRLNLISSVLGKETNFLKKYKGDKLTIKLIEYTEKAVSKLQKTNNPIGEEQENAPAEKHGCFVQMVKKLCCPCFESMSGRG